MSENCRKFIEQCLAKEGHERLGTMNDVQEVLLHPWLSDIDVDKIMKKEVPAEY